MMRAWTSLLLLLLTLLGRPAEAGEIARAAVPSPSLKHEFPYLVYLPDGYAASSQRYPVLYLLHGAGGEESDWVTRGQIKETADALIARGAIPPSIIVMPGCPTCWWVDGRQDKAETAFWNDLVPAIDHTYRTIARRDGRLVAGVSAGGYGAIRFGLKYPDRVTAVAALSPAIYSDTPPAESAARVQPPFMGPDNKFSQTAWAARNYPSLLAGYYAQPNRTAVYVVSGDDDTLGISFESALLHKRLSSRQPGMCELRVLDGEHSWSLWKTVLADAMTYLYRRTPSLIAEKPKTTAHISTVDVR